MRAPKLNIINAYGEPYALMIQINLTEKGLQVELHLFAQRLFA